MSIKIGELKLNKFGGSTIGITMEPILFKNTFTFGIQKSKFDEKKLTMSLALDEEQQEMMKKIREDVLKSLVDQDVEVKGVKSSFCGNNMYVKVSSFSAFDEKDKELKLSEVLELENYKGNIAIKVIGVYVKDEIAHLQVYLQELVILEKKERIKPDRVVF